MKYLSTISKGVKRVVMKTGRKKTSQEGFTLIEILVVLAILAILLLIFLFYMHRHLMRARDARRKADIEELKFAFEEYYNDYRCFPPPEVLLNCGVPPTNNEGEIEGFENPFDEDRPYPHLYPNYIEEIPCDPLTNDPYLYYSRNNDSCGVVRVLAKLEIEDDKDIINVGCSQEDGCGDTNNVDYNYGMATDGDVGGQGWGLGGGAGGTPISRWYCVYKSGTDSAECGSYTYEVIQGDDYECPENGQYYFDEAGDCEDVCALEYDYICYPQ